MQPGRPSGAYYGLFEPAQVNRTPVSPRAQAVSAQPGFFEGLFGVIDPEIERHRQMADEERLNKISAYKEILMAAAQRGDGATAQWAVDEIQKLYPSSKPIKQIFGRLAGLFGRMKGAGGAQADVSAPTPGTAPTPPGVGPTGGANIGDVTPSRQLLPAPRNRAAEVEAETTGQMPMAAAQEAAPRDLSSFYAGATPPPQSAPAPAQMTYAEAIRKTHLTPQQQTQERTALLSSAVKQFMAENPDATLEQALNAVQGIGISTSMGQWKPIVTRGVDRSAEGLKGSWVRQDWPDGTTTWLQEAARPSSARATAPSQFVTTLDAATRNIAEGMEYLDPSDKPWTEARVKSLPPNQVLQGILMPGGALRWEPRNRQDKVVTVGNMRIAVSPYEVEQIPQGAGTAIGPAQVGSQSVTDTTLTGTETRRVVPTPGAYTTGRFGTPAQGQAQPAAGAAAGAAKALPGPAAVGGGGSPKIWGAQAQQQINLAQRALQGASQAVGDPSNPQAETLRLAEAVLDDPQELKYFQNAWAATQHALEDVKVDNPGFWSYLMAWGRLPAEIEQELARTNSEKINAMGPAGRRLYDKLMAVMGTWPSVRALTGMNAAQWSTRLMMMELPIPGISVTDKASLYRRLANMTQEVGRGMQMLAPPVLSPGAPQEGPRILDYYKNLQREYQQKAEEMEGGAAKSPPPQGQIGKPGQRAPQFPAVQVYDRDEKTGRLVPRK